MTLIKSGYATGTRTRKRISTRGVSSGNFATSGRIDRQAQCTSNGGTTSSRRLRCDQKPGCRALCATVRPRLKNPLRLSALRESARACRCACGRSAEGVDRHEWWHRFCGNDAAPFKDTSRVSGWIQMHNVEVFSDDLNFRDHRLRAQRVRGMRVKKNLHAKTHRRIGQHRNLAHH